MQCPCGGDAKTTYDGTIGDGINVASHCESCGRRENRLIKGKKPKGLRAKFKKAKIS